MKNDSMRIRLNRARLDGKSLLLHRIYQTIRRARMFAMDMSDNLSDWGYWYPQEELIVSTLLSQGATWGKEDGFPVLFLNGIVVASKIGRSIKIYY